MGDTTDASFQHKVAVLPTLPICDSFIRSVKGPDVKWQHWLHPSLSAPQLIYSSQRFTKVSTPLTVWLMFYHIFDLSLISCLKDKSLWYNVNTAIHDWNLLTKDATQSDRLFQAFWFSSIAMVTTSTHWLAHTLVQPNPLLIDVLKLGWIQWIKAELDNVFIAENRKYFSVFFNRVLEWL